MRGPIVAANACCESTPKTAMATAIASSYAGSIVISEWNRISILTHKIITSCRKSLSNCHLVSEFSRAWSFSPREIKYEEKRRVPHKDEIENLRNNHTKNRSQVMNDTMTLVGK